jgi:hypothetical protein
MRGVRARIDDDPIECRRDTGAVEFDVERAAMREYVCRQTLLGEIDLLEDSPVVLDPHVRPQHGVLGVRVVELPHVRVGEVG